MYYIITLFAIFYYTTKFTKWEALSQSHISDPQQA